MWCIWFYRAKHHYFFLLDLTASQKERFLSVFPLFWPNASSNLKVLFSLHSQGMDLSCISIFFYLHQYFSGNGCKLQILSFRYKSYTIHHNALKFVFQHHIRMRNIALTFQVCSAHNDTANIFWRSDKIKQIFEKSGPYVVQVPHGRAWSIV